MRYLNSFLFLHPAATLAAQYIVEVGDGGKFAYSPDTVQAAEGDTVVFEFYPGDHSVAQSTFDNPCQPSANGIWSGFFNPISGKDPNVFEITIKDTNPIWIYCAQAGHCTSGMAMVINPPTSGSDTLAAYKSAAINAKNVVPQNVQGGVVTAASAAQTSETSESSASSASSASSRSTSASGSSTSSTSSTVATTGSSSSSANATSSASAASAASSPPTSATFSASTTKSSSSATLTGASSKYGVVGALVGMVGAGWLGLVMM